MKVWIVTADDHDYDAMSAWVVGAYSTAARADAAKKRDKKAYKGSLRGGPNYSTIHAAIDEDVGKEQ